MSKPRLALRLGDQLLEEWTSAEITRDLEEISGGFRVEVLDLARTAAALPAWWRPDLLRGPILPGERVSLALDGEVVLLGWLDAVEVNYGPDKVGLTLTGRDLTGDLVDCAAAPEGPAEYLGLTLTEICARLCAPYGITVTADVDVGAPFPRFGIEVGETAMSAIEKGCRQRGVLAISDGVGGLRLTRGGRSPAPAPLVFGENILTADATFDHAERFSTYLVKGQAARGGGGVVLDGTANELLPGPVAGARPAPTSPAGPRPGVVMTGRATDAAVRRHRPTVSLSKTQSGGTSVQEQADWRMRTARARSESIRVVVADLRAGEAARLWRINERVLVDDPLAQASHELLVAALTWRLGPDGSRTELKLCGPEAFDILPEPEPRTARAATPRRLDGTAGELRP